jgi:hypothetical protein
MPREAKAALLGELADAFHEFRTRHAASTRSSGTAVVNRTRRSAWEMLIYWASCPKIIRSRKTRFPGSFIFSDLRRRKWRGVLPRTGNANKSALP